MSRDTPTPAGAATNSGVVLLALAVIPAINTPQFEWVRSRLPRRPQPVPPIFEPEVAARAIVWASQHRRRDLWVGLPTFKAIVGNRFIQGVLDRHLARRGYDDQQTGEPVPSDRRDNLWRSATGVHATHGRFDMRATSRSAYLWATTHRALVTAASMVLAALGLAAITAAT